MRTRSPCSSFRRSSSASPARPRARAAASSRARSCPRPTATEVVRRQALTAGGDRAARRRRRAVARRARGRARRGGARSARRGARAGRAAPGRDGGRDRARGAARARRGGRAGAAAPRAGRPRSSRRSPSLAESIDRCVDEDGSDLRDNASPQLRRLRAELRNGKQRVTEELDARRAVERADRVPPGAVRHRARRTARARGEDLGAREGAGRRPRLVELGADALRRAVRDRRAEQPARRGSERRARGGRADPARAVGARRRPRAASSRRWSRRPARSTSPSLARRSHDAGAAPPSRSPTTCGCSPRGIRCSTEQTAVPIDLDLGDLRVLVVSGPNTGGKTVALKTLGLAALLASGRAAPARGRGDAAGVRPRARRRRRRAVDRDEPLDVLGAPPQHRLDPRRRHRALARAARRARGRHRSGRRLGARAGAARAALAAGAG